MSDVRKSFRLLNNLLSRPNVVKLEHDSYLDTALRETVSDLVFSCQLAGESAHLAMLVKHQSRPDAYMPVRMGHYLFSLLTKQLKQQPKTHKELLAPVYALVFYHGRHLTKVIGPCNDIAAQVKRNRPR